MIISNMIRILFLAKKKNCNEGFVFSGATCTLSWTLPGRVAFRVWIRYSKFKQHLAELDRGGTRVADDAREGPQRQCGHRDQIF